MNANEVIADSRVAHVRELKAEIARLRGRLAEATDELAEWHAHFDLAVLAAADAARVPPDGRIVIVDGYNLVFNEYRHDRDALLRAAAGVEADFVWVVFDGPRESAEVDGRVRVSYTGGTGAHRADRLVIDYVRMLRRGGDSHEVVVVTGDRDFRKAVEKEGATCRDRL